MIKWPRPTSLRSLRGFLGLTGYYRKFVKGYGVVTKPLTNLLKKNSFCWNEEVEGAFNELKQLMSSAPVLALPNFTQPFVLETDANGSPIAYLSKYLGVKPRQKGITKLLGLDYSINYRSGHENKATDALSMYALTNQQGELQAISVVVSGCYDTRVRYILVTLLSSNRDLFLLLMILQLGDIQLPKSEGKDVIMVVVDKFTKFAHFMALAHPYSAEKIAKIFLDNILKLHGVPTNIVSDKDKVFTSLFWQQLFKALGTKLHMSTAYHPQSDGQTERLNRCLENYLRCMTFQHPYKWSSWISLAK
ncbi:uncharacterized protein LOC110671574 [Hevea brasiliensis]|uniref:uncharacterized protein LOC110671574 n=1 Tax=Hevea brasiliensis TaxID=3981 RepID=UPI0025E007E8|nr:uncharacterized protein LOC110671574 [Hevea brasiliensis]